MEKGNRNLNSIMILLIRKSAIQKQMKHASFKFHYDSINSDEEKEEK